MSFPTPASSFPVGDWQFWVATLIALVSLLLILKAVLPGKLKARLGLRARTPGRSVRLTISGGKGSSARKSGGSMPHSGR